MSDRQQLNQHYYQQALQFAKNFADSEKAEYLRELSARHEFEMAQQTHSLQISQPKRPLVMLMVGILLAFSIVGYFYWQTGRYTQVQQGTQAFQTFQQQRAEESSQERNQHYIVNLQQQLRENPNHGELWFELGQAYSLNNDFEAALVCFQNAQTVLGEKAAILGAKATADYYLHKQILTPQAQQWIEQALKQDPKENASLLLLASDAFLHNDFKQAITFWEQALEGDNPSLNRREVIQSIRMAEQRLNSLK